MKLLKIIVKSEWVDEATGEIITDERVLGDDSAIVTGKQIGRAHV